MAPNYAKDQPAGFTNRIERVAIVGAGGQQGKFITEELLKTGKHTITALTRKESKHVIPAGVKVVHIDYNDEATLVAALQGQQFLVITMSVHAPPDQQSKLIQAAAKAGVDYIMPNGYGGDMRCESLMRDSPLGNAILKTTAEIEKTGKSWISLVCSLWYEYSLACGPEWFGFDFKTKNLTFYDDGNTRINTTTWRQCGRAVAALIGLKELPDDENDKSPTVRTWANQPLYVSSFLISQRDMFESWKRITGDTDADWMIEYQNSEKRRAEGLERLKAGDRRGLAVASFVRVFYPNGDGNYEGKYGLANDALGLPKEDLDEATKLAKKMIDAGYDPRNRG
ncbi:putative Oxidoreductase CipA [Pleurostoma richardsiae]|uniref:Oxidoreductase CipA n=1 Tax=Pleurostoma richardsiae TaxID=41990 RepID=A0AA38RF03_9PEZI|nr:putative Oxidoreductase CipA [Pleurostoma richardsiae]